MPAKTAIKAGKLTVFNEARESRPNINESKPVPISVGRGQATNPYAVKIPPITAAMISQCKCHLDSVSSNAGEGMDRAGANILFVGRQG